MYTQKIKATINETGQIIPHESIQLKAGEVEIIIFSEVQDSKPLSLQQIVKMPLDDNTFANLVQRVEKTLTVNFLSSEAWQK